GDTVSYRIIPMVRDTGGALTQLNGESSKWSMPITLGKLTSKTFQPFFNRGFVMSQFMARYLSENKLTLKEFKDRINDEHDTTIRAFLSGDLRLELLRQLQIADQEQTHVYAALFELSDDELVEAVCKLGARAHIVLANGSITAKKGEGAANARLRDENR